MGPISRRARSRCGFGVGSGAQWFGPGACRDFYFGSGGAFDAQSWPLSRLHRSDGWLATQQDPRARWLTGHGGRWTSLPPSGLRMVKALANRWRILVARMVFNPTSRIAAAKVGIGRPNAMF